MSSPFDPRQDDPQEPEGPADWRRQPPPITLGPTLLERYRSIRPLKRGRFEGAIVILLLWGIVTVLFADRGEKAAKPADAKTKALMASSSPDDQVVQRHEEAATAPKKRLRALTEPAPAESAPTAAEPKKTAQVPTPEPPAKVLPSKPVPVAPVFTAAIAADFSSVVSHKIKGSEEKKVATAFDEVIGAFGGDYKFKSAEKGEWVYTRNAPGAQAVTAVTVTAQSVTVTLKQNPSDEQLGRLTKPAQSLAKALGLKTEGVWTGDGTTRTYVFRTGIPDGIVK